MNPRLTRSLLVLTVLATILASSPLAHATVSLEYLGPYPLSPKPVSGHAQTIADQFKVGNNGDEATVVNITVWSTDPNFTTNFRYTLTDPSGNMLVSDANGTLIAKTFTLQPTQREQITATFKYLPTTPIQSYSAHVGIVAAALHVPQGASPGHASFDLPVDISSSAIPEFPTASGLVLALSLLLAFGLMRARKLRRLPHRD